MRLAIAGDLHGDWTCHDEQLLEQLRPDALLFVGDLRDGDLRLVKAITRLKLPCAVILGNHEMVGDGPVLIANLITLVPAVIVLVLKLSNYL